MRLSRLAYCLVATLAGLPFYGCQENRLPGMTATSSSDDASSRPAGGAAAAPDSGQAATSQPTTAKSSTGQSSTGQQSQARPAAGGQSARTAPARTTPARTLNINFDDIKFDMEKGDPFQRSMLAGQIESLAGKKIRIRGYVHPAVFTQTGITRFVLVRDNLECCFGPGAMLYDCIMVTMNSGKSIDYTTRPIAVEGIFSIEEVVYDGQHLAIYRIDADSAG